MNDTKAQDPNEKRHANILLVEDREDDVFFFRRALQSAGLPHVVTAVGDGEEAIQYLSGQPPYDNHTLYPPPDVVILDLKMPKKDGFQVLQWLREQSALKPAPVVVLTSSDRPDDQARAKTLGALNYYIKPVDFDKLVRVAKDINRRWLISRRAHGLLIVDDDENDRFLIEHAFRRLDAGYQINTLASGSEAVAYLKGAGVYADRKKYPFPSYILTDLKMGPGDGFEILDYLKQNPSLSVIPVVMLSGSDDPDDIRHAYLLGASSYIVKPPAIDALEVLVQKLHYYWLDCEAPAVDESGNAIVTDSTGKAGARFAKPRKPA
jgi:CheY-like chemotaxis protein